MFLYLQRRYTPDGHLFVYKMHKKRLYNGVFFRHPKSLQCNCAYNII